MDRVCATIQLEGSKMNDTLGVIIANTSLSRSALNHFRGIDCKPMVFFQMDINDDLLLKLFDLHGLDIEQPKLYINQLDWSDNDEFQRFSNGDYISEILINSSGRKILPNASVSRILLPQKRYKLLFSC